MSAFHGPGRIGGFDHLSGAARDKEIARTKRAVVDLLQKPRSEFPAIEVRFLNKIMPAHVVDAAFTAARQARRASHDPAGFDWLAAMSAALPAALESDRARIARLEPKPVLTSDGERKSGEMARDGLPKELQAPLILEIQTVAF